MSGNIKDARREVRAAIKKRGQRRYNVWAGFASKGNFHFSLDGSPNADHLVWMEGDTNVVSYTIPTTTVVGRGSDGPVGTIPDAICVLRSGQVEWREIKTETEANELRNKQSEQMLAQSSAAQEHGARWRIITTADLNKNALLIRNWREGLSYITSAINFDLAPYEHDVLLIAGDDRSRRLADILASYTPENEALLVAGFFRLVQKGIVESDLATYQFGLQTMVRRSQRRGHGR